MKNGKLLFLLIAIMSLAVLFCACDPVPTGDTSETANETTSAETSPIVEPEEVEHEIRDHFVIDNGIDSVSFADITKIDGEIIDIDEENKLMSVVLKDLDNYNNVIKTIKVYDITTCECIFEDSVTYPLNATGEDMIDFNVKIDYPIIRVSKISYSEDSDALEPQYDISYYFAKKDSASIKDTDDNSYSRTNYYNGLVAFEMGDEIFWVNRNMEVVRTVNAVAANGYEIDVFNAEYQDYLYAWNRREVQVFNKAGVCSAKYTIQHEGFLNVHVLNDGSVLIQDLEEVDAYTACDFVLVEDYYLYTDACRYNMTSYVMSCTDGTLKEVELDFIVEELETAYEGRLGNNNFPFALAGNGQNQAYIYRIANGKVSLWQEYVSLGNDLEVKYTVKNNKIGAAFYTAEAINANFYRMYVYEGGAYQSYIFDLDGNVITASTGNSYVTDTYVATSNAIYDHNMNVVFDIAASDFAGGLISVDSSTNTIYFSKHNFTTGANEIYTFDHATKAPKLLIDGVKSEFLGALDGFYVTYNEEDNDYSFINTVDGKVVLKLLNFPSPTLCEDNILIVESSFENETIVYVIK